MPKLNVKRTILTGLAFLSISAFWQVYDSIIPLILKEDFAIGDTIAGGVMALDNVLALFLLPLFGTLSDKTHTRLGRRMPFIVCGTALAVVCMIQLPLAANARNLVWFMCALGLTLLSMGLYRSPAVALMPDLTPKPVRSKGNAVINLMGSVGGIASLALIALLVPKTENPSYLPLFAAVACIMVAAVTVLALTIRENRMRVPDEPREERKDSPARGLTRPEKRSLVLILSSVFFWFMGYNAVTTAFSKYARFYWGLTGGAFSYTLIVAQAAAICAYLPVAALSGKIGRRKTILCGVALLAAVFGSAALFKTFNAGMFALFALAGIAWAAINVNSYPMVVELARGADVGRYTGFYYTFSMAAQILTPILSGALLENVGYVTLFPYGALCVAVSFVTMLFVRHGDAKAEKPASRLEAFANPDD